MKRPVSLIDKEIKVKVPYDWKCIDVNYIDHQVSTALETYPDSIVIKNLTDIIKELKLDIIASRSHSLWLEYTEEAL